MSGNPDGLRMLARSSKLAAGRLTYLADGDQQAAKSIRRGILMIMAFWSGPALGVFRSLTETVAKLDLHEQLEIVIVDIDGTGIESLASKYFPDGLAGAGETVWIRKGQVASSTGFGMNLDCLAPNTAALLAMD